MDQDETWHAGRPPALPTLRWTGTRLPLPQRGTAPNFRPISVVDQDATWYEGRLWPRRLCVRWGRRSPPPKRGRSPPNFRPMFIVAKQYGWIKIVLGMEIGLSPGDFVLNGDPVRPLNFRPMFIIVIVILLEHCTGVRHYWFVQVKF